jgi:hypothetical protein
MTRSSLAPKPRRTRHWRCADCGSFQVYGIAEAMAEGRLDPHQAVLRLDESADVSFDVHDGQIDPTSVQCRRCLGGHAERVLLSEAECELSELEDARPRTLPLGRL